MLTFILIIYIFVFAVSFLVVKVDSCLDLNFISYGHKEGRGDFSCAVSVSLYAFVIIFKWVLYLILIICGSNSRNIFDDDSSRYLDTNNPKHMNYGAEQDAERERTTNYYE